MANNILKIGPDLQAKIRARLLPRLNEALEGAKTNVSYFDAYIIGIYEQTPGTFAAVLLAELKTDEGKSYVIPQRQDLSFGFLGLRRREDGAYVEENPQ